MIKKLYEIDFGYDPKIDQKSFDKLRMFEPGISWYDLAHFVPSDYAIKHDDKFKGLSKEKLNEYAEEQYQEYLGKDVRAFDVPYNANGLRFVDLDQFLAADIDIAFTVKQSHEITIKDTSSFGLDLFEYQKMFKTLERLSHQLESREAFNQKCSVHIGGHHLMTINRTMLCEDCCTDNLQRHLNSGWRIIACCAQEARRPDYILGMYDGSFNGNGMAERG